MWDGGAIHYYECMYAALSSVPCLGPVAVLLYCSRGRAAAGVGGNGGGNSGPGLPLFSSRSPSPGVSQAVLAVGQGTTHLPRLPRSLDDRPSAAHLIPSFLPTYLSPIVKRPPEAPTRTPTLTHIHTHTLRRTQTHTHGLTGDGAHPAQRHPSCLSACMRLG